MAQIHRNNDLRSDGSSTIVVGQTTVYANNQLISVQNDPCSHGGGELAADVGEGTVFINNLPVVVVGSSASTDNVAHPNPSASTGSDTVHVY